ncbi:MAG: cytochrome b/b6 domain-containing protein [Candidatus Halalkalibacterium sp. M3_1C_030]
MAYSGSGSDTDQNWTRTLLILVSGFLLFETLTGLSIYLLPFSISNQFIVLIHTLIGVIFCIPYIIYQVQHWLRYRERPLNEIKLTGYVSMVVAIAAMVSGIVLTWQALFTPGISYFWNKIHILSTFVLLASLVPHVSLIVWRDYRARNKEPMKERLEAERKYGINTLMAVLVQFALALLFIYAFEPTPVNNKLPEDYHHLDENGDRPFAPSLATTADGEGIDDILLGGSESCSSSGCHEQIGEEWEASAHRYSAMDPAFRAVQNAMGEQKGPMSTRYCGGCHDPISLFSGTKNMFSDSLTNKMGLDEGVSCVSCHAIQQADVSGNAEYVIAPPERYIFELKDGKTAKLISDFLIRAYPKKHIETFQRPLFKTPEFCATCHKQFIDEEVNNVGWVQLQNQYDNWRKSRWNHPKEPMKTVECRECHMPLVDSFDPAKGDPLDYNRSNEDGKHRSHRFLGANQMIPTLLDLPGAEKHVKLVEEWLRGEIEIPEIADKWKPGKAIPIKLVGPGEIESGSDLNISIVITNNKTGHNFPTGPLDIIQAWLEIVVKDQDGNKVYTSGTLDDRNFIKPGAFIFKAEPVDQYNNIIDRHNLWEMVGVRYSRALYPGHSDNAYFEIPIPDSLGAEKDFALNIPSDKLTEGESAKILTISAKLQYRKINQYLMNAVFGNVYDDPTAHITTLSTDQKEVKVIPNSSSR